MKHRFIPMIGVVAVLVSSSAVAQQQKTVWKMGENGYSWTDGEHFLVSLGGAPPPPQEMVKAWLVMIDSKVAEVEKKGDKSQAPAKPPKE